MALPIYFFKQFRYRMYIWFSHNAQLYDDNSWSYCAVRSARNRTL